MFCVVVPHPTAPCSSLDVPSSGQEQPPCVWPFGGLFEPAWVSQCRGTLHQKTLSDACFLPPQTCTLVYTHVPTTLGGGVKGLFQEIAYALVVFFFFGCRMATACHS